jgi:hypothetical protein
MVWGPHARSQALRSLQFPLDLLLHPQVLRVQQEVLVATAVLQGEPGHHQLQGSDHGFVPEGTQ